MNGWDIVNGVVNIFARLPLERLVPRSSDKDFDELTKRLGEHAQGSANATELLQAAPKAAPEAGGSQPKTPPVSDEETLTYQFDLLQDDLQHLETEHLPSKGRIMGKPCDCISKAARDLRRHARETIPIASRQGKDAKFYSKLSDWAEGLIDIGGSDAVASGRYDSLYLREAGTASNFRKQVEQLRSGLTGQSAVRSEETKKPGCQECAEIQSLKEFITHKLEH